jgi:hypothetical protein
LLLLQVHLQACVAARGRGILVWARAHIPTIVVRHDNDFVTATVKLRPN